MRHSLAFNVLGRSGAGSAPALVSSCLLLVATAACHDLPTPIPRVLPVEEDRNVVWSNDGQWLAFEHVSPDSAYPAIYVSRVDRSGRRRVIPQGFDPTWSPDGRFLAFDVGSQIYRLDLATDSVLALTSTGRNVVPAWSPDGRSIAFSSDGGDSRNPPDLWLMSADGSDPRRIPLGQAPRNGLGDASWAPTGDRIVASGAYSTSAVTFVQAIFVTDTAGRDTAWITPPTVTAGDPQWSPRGDWIVYDRLQSDRADVRLVHPDGSGDHLLVANAYQPYWAPDGQRIAFSRRTADEVAIWSVDSDGQGLQQLSRPRVAKPRSGGSGP